MLIASVATLTRYPELCQRKYRLGTKAGATVRASGEHFERVRPLGDEGTSTRFSNTDITAGVSNG